MPTIVSVPALGAALHSGSAARFSVASRDLFAGRELAPMYRLGCATVEQEAHDAARMVEQTAERLRRLVDAYAAWQEFDAGAYFDLTPSQVGHLVKVTERVDTVHVLFFSDLLLPSFGAAADSWRLLYATPVTASGTSIGQASRADRSVQPDMQTHWERLLDVCRTAVRALAEDVSFLTMHAAAEERRRWQTAWSLPPSSLDPVPAGLPTLTLVCEFPLPAARQPGRLRRLRWHVRTLKR